MNQATPDGDSEDYNYNMYPLSTTVRLMARVARMSTAADALPSMLSALVVDARMSALVFSGVYISLVLIWLPFWLLTFLLTEIGVYVLVLATVFFLGRCLIRLIAFPGSTHRVSGEIEVEFARYSVRMIQVAAGCLIELCSAILATSGSQTQSTFGQNDIPSLWNRARSYRDRVLGVFLDVLDYLYKEAGEGTAYGSSYGNNPVSGDIGNLSTMTAQARADGKSLVALLRTVLGLLKKLEHQAAPVLKSSGKELASPPLPEEAWTTVRSLLNSATELRDVVSSFKPAGQGLEDPETGTSDDIDNEVDAGMEAVRRQLEKDSGSAFDALRGSAAAILPLLDPQPHSSVFGLDVIRGCVLSRYRGARQLWVRRPTGGKLDAIHIPAVSNVTTQGRNRKAVLYCNPNAGLIEVATGMSLAGGNVSAEDGSHDECWADFYTQNGYDIFLFNYAGFGRSMGHSLTIADALSCFSRLLLFPGFLGCCTRFFCSTLFSFKPSPDSLRDDATTMGTYIVTEGGFKNLVLHGESIGGLAAAGAAKTLSQKPGTKDKLSLLVCDRTFCNLEAVAQRLVGGWTGPAIRALAPFWNTDIAADFLAADCRKVMANDAEDAIIADAASLKSGVSLSKETRKGLSTNGVGWKMEAPVEYRMADFENVSVTASRYAAPTSTMIRPPVWPADKQISLGEAFHFAACARRIGKVATVARKARLGTSRSGGEEEEEEGLEVDDAGVPSSSFQTQADILVAWKMLGCCDGLSGSTLGAAVKNGYDCSVSWLCSTVTFGGQVIAAAALRRLGHMDGPVLPADYDTRPSGYQLEESDMLIHPKPIPEVIDVLRRSLDGGDDVVKLVEDEIRYCVSVLEYVVARLSSKQSLEASYRGLELRDSLGAFIELHCGHNSPFSAEERIKLQTFLDRATRSS